PFKLVGIIFPCHRGGSSRFPRQSCGIKRVQHTGAGPKYQKLGIDAIRIESPASQALYDTSRLEDVSRIFSEYGVTAETG
ncbi:hypothetical protein ORI20_14585, partial [Mycobacterium sp. CVI_P3]